MNGVDGLDIGRARGVYIDGERAVVVWGDDVYSGRGLVINGGRAAVCTLLDTVRGRVVVVGMVGVIGRRLTVLGM